MGGRFRGHFGQSRANRKDQPLALPIERAANIRRDFDKLLLTPAYHQGGVDPGQDFGQRDETRTESRSLASVKSWGAA